MHLALYVRDLHEMGHSEHRHLLPQTAMGARGLPAPSGARKPRIRQPSSIPPSGRAPEPRALGSAQQGVTNAEGMGEEQTPMGTGTGKAGRSERGSILFSVLVE